MMKKCIITDMTFAAQVCTKNGLSFRERLQIAKTIAQAGVDRMVLPALTGKKEDVVIWRTIAESIPCTAAMVCGDSEASIQAAWDCVKSAQKPCLRIVLPISTVQMEYRYHKKAAAMLDFLAELCRTASNLCENVEFVAEDASRAEEGFAASCAKTAWENGAKGVTICDDSGVFFPEHYTALLAEIRAVCGAKIYVQPSDAFGMAYACAVSAIAAGADGVVCASGAKEIMDTARFADLYRAKGESLGISCALDITAIHRLLDGISTSRNTDISDTQEIISVTDHAVFAQNMSAAEISAAVKELGYELSDEDHGKVYDEYRRVSEKKSSIDAKELEAIVASTAMQVPSTYHLESYVVNSGNIITATANVTLTKDGVAYHGVSVGDGPIDAAFHAIEQIIGHHYELDDFRIQAVTKGREAVGSSLIRLRKDGKLYAGNGVSTDIIGACVRAYINALNKIVYEEN